VKNAAAATINTAQIGPALFNIPFTIALSLFLLLLPPRFSMANNFSGHFGATFA
jgi:hypothetical protein